MLRGDLAMQDKREKQETRERKNEMRYYFLKMALWRGSTRIRFSKAKEKK
jgi:hypothetical protein